MKRVRTTMGFNIAQRSLCPDACCEKPCLSQFAVCSLIPKLGLKKLLFLHHPDLDVDDTDQFEALLSVR